VCESIVLAAAGEDSFFNVSIGELDDGDGEEVAVSQSLVT
jgi:hypothetical protein